VGISVQKKPEIRQIFLRFGHEIDAHALKAVVGRNVGFQRKSAKQKQRAN
jgi:hypothetical protein